MVRLMPWLAAAHTSLLPDTQTNVKLGQSAVWESGFLEAPSERPAVVALEWALGPCLAAEGSMTVAGSIEVWLLASVLVVSARRRQPLIGLGK
jgi:hypothetical protein